MNFEQRPGNRERAPTTESGWLYLWGWCCREPEEDSRELGSRRGVIIPVEFLALGILESHHFGRLARATGETWGVTGTRGIVITLPREERAAESLQKPHRHRQQHGAHQRGRGDGGGGRGQWGINGDGGRLDLGWWTHSTICGWCVIELYTWNVCNFVNQCHPNKFNKVFLKAGNVSQGTGEAVRRYR